MNHSKRFELTEFCQLRMKFGFEEACRITKARIHRRADAQENQKILYPIDTFSIWDTPQDIETRKRCHKCDVEAACLHFAVTEKLPNLVYGGLNHLERAPLEERYDELFGPDAPPIVDDLDLSRRESEFWSLLEAQVEQHANVE